MYSPAAHLMLSKWISKIQHADMKEGHVTHWMLGSIHDQGLGSVGDIIYMHHNGLVLSKFSQQVLNK